MFYSTLILGLMLFYLNDNSILLVITHFFGLQKKLQEVIVPWGFGAFGFIFYLTRYPEKLWRKSGFFDILGASHQVNTISKLIRN